MLLILAWDTVDHLFVVNYAQVANTTPAPDDDDIWTSTFTQRAELVERVVQPCLLATATSSIWTVPDAEESHHVLDGSPSPCRSGHERLYLLMSLQR